MRGDFFVAVQRNSRLTCLNDYHISIEKPKSSRRLENVRGWDATTRRFRGVRLIWLIRERQLRRKLSSPIGPKGLYVTITTKAPTHRMTLHGR